MPPPIAWFSVPAYSSPSKTSSTATAVVPAPPKPSSFTCSHTTPSAVRQTSAPVEEFAVPA